MSKWQIIQKCPFKVNVKMAENSRIAFKVNVKMAEQKNVALKLMLKWQKNQ